MVCSFYYPNHYITYIKSDNFLKFDDIRISVEFAEQLTKSNQFSKSYENDFSSNVLYALLYVHFRFDTYRQGKLTLCFSAADSQEGSQKKGRAEPVSQVRRESVGWCWRERDGELGRRLAMTGERVRWGVPKVVTLYCWT